MDGNRTARDRAQELMGGAQPPQPGTKPIPAFHESTPPAPDLIGYLLSGDNVEKPGATFEGDASDLAKLLVQFLKQR